MTSSSNDGLDGRSDDANTTSPPPSQLPPCKTIPTVESSLQTADVPTADIVTADIVTADIATTDIPVAPTVPEPSSRDDNVNSSTPSPSPTLAANKVRPVTPTASSSGDGNTQQPAKHGIEHSPMEAQTGANKVADITDSLMHIAQEEIEQSQRQEESVISNGQVQSQRQEDSVISNGQEPNQLSQRQEFNQLSQQDSAMAISSQYVAPSTPFTPVTAAAIDHTYVMMALASISSAPSALSPPPTVAPAQVSLPNPLATINELDTGNTVRHPVVENGLESFARIEFADSVFQMTTYAVIIGRDQRALEQARFDEKRAGFHKRRIEENASKGLPPPSLMLNDSKFSKSYVSEEGGMLGPESDSEESIRPTKRRKTSTAGSPQYDFEENPENIISNRQYVSHTPGAAAVDLTSLRPSPWHVPFIGIHSPGPNIASKTKAISREHLKIAYNQKEGVFEAIPLHTNGFFCEDVHYNTDKVVLRCGNRLQIKDIDFRFIINGVERGRTGAEDLIEEKSVATPQTHGGKEMSFEFEQAHGNGNILDTSDELSDVEGSLPELSDIGEDLDGDEEMADDIAVEGEDAIETEAFKDEAGMLVPEIPKKRGPGRPPKNGIMSKREQRLLKKQQQEMAKKTLPPVPSVEMPIKRKVGRPRKHPLPENAGDQPEKRKYKPRKPREDGAEGSDAERRAREKKEKRARPKSPPLELNIEDYTEEQLQKPNKNYGVLIDETLTAAGPDGLTLKQIYKRICQRYPWFHFHTETKGWESSVRHNLIGNEAFRKDETTNLWSRVIGVELDAGKKRKASSPDRAMTQAYGSYAHPFNAQQMQGYQGQVSYQMQGYQPRPAQYTQAPPLQQPQQAYAVGAQPQQPHQQGYSMAPLRHPQQAPHHPVAVQPLQAAPMRRYNFPIATAAPGVGDTYRSPYLSQPPLPPSADNATGLYQRAASQAPRSDVNPAQPQQSAAGSNATTASSRGPSRAVIEPRLLQAVVGLKNGLVENLKRARNPKAEAIVMSALNRCVGLKKEATENDKMEAICIRGISQVIDGIAKNNRSPTPSGTTSNDRPQVLEAKVLDCLIGFKNVSTESLKSRLGDAKAEAVTLSAIDRVLGFVDASIVPLDNEGETSASFEGLEQRLMRTVRILLLGLNQKLGSN